MLCLLFVQDRALDYLSTCIDQVQTFGDILQLVIVELIYKVKGKYTVIYFKNGCTAQVLLDPLIEQLEHGWKRHFSHLRMSRPSSIAFCFQLEYFNSFLKQIFVTGIVGSLLLTPRKGYLLLNFLSVQVCHANPSERARFIRCIYNLLQSSSPAVKYEAAGTLVTLSSAPTAIKVQQCYFQTLQYLLVHCSTVCCTLYFKSEGFSKMWFLTVHV